MGEQTILCGMLQTGAILCFNKMVENGIDAGYAAKLIQYGHSKIVFVLLIFFKDKTICFLSLSLSLSLSPSPFASLFPPLSLPSSTLLRCYFPAAALPRRPSTLPPICANVRFLKYLIWLLASLAQSLTNARCRYGWEAQTEALKHGGITGMLDRLDNPSKLKCMELAEELKEIMYPLYHKHQDDIISGAFSEGMMADWDNGDANLLKWRAATGETAFEKTPAGAMEIPEQEYFDNCVLMVAMCKAGVELAFEQMVAVGMTPEPVTHPRRVVVNVRAQTGCTADPLRRGVGVPHQCSSLGCR